MTTTRGSAAAPQSYFDGAAGGNLVLIGSDSPIDPDSVTAALARTEGSEEVLEGSALTAFVDGAPVLTDDHAPVDQLISRR